MIIYLSTDPLNSSLNAYLQEIFGPWISEIERINDRELSEPISDVSFSRTFGDFLALTGWSTTIKH
jgi:hypothetical protein